MMKECHSHSGNSGRVYFSGLSQCKLFVLCGGKNSACPDCHKEAEVGPSGAPAEGVWKGGGSQHSHFLGILVAQTCLVTGWVQGRPWDLRVLGFMQDKPLMRTAVSKPGEAAEISVKGVGVLLVHPCSLNCLIYCGP